MHHDAKRALVLVLVLVSVHLCEGLDGPVPITPDRLDTGGDAVGPLDGRTAGQLSGGPGRDALLFTSQDVTADVQPAATAPDTGAPSAACVVPTLDDWVLRRGARAVCPFQPGDGDDAAYLEDIAAAGPPLSVGVNVTEAQPSAEQLPVPEAAMEEQLEVGDEERQNFAASKDGAKIVAANKEAKKAASLLDDDGDTFLKNECKADKFVIIELAQMVKVDTLKVGVTRGSQLLSLVSVSQFSLPVSRPICRRWTPIWAATVCMLCWLLGGRLCPTFSPYGTPVWSSGPSQAKAHIILALMASMPVASGVPV